MWCLRESDLADGGKHACPLKKKGWHGMHSSKERRRYPARQDFMILEKRLCCKNLICFEFLSYKLATHRIYGMQVQIYYIPRQYQRGEYMARSKDVVFTMKLENELRDAFMAAADAEDRPASQIVREFMRRFVAERKLAAELTSVTPEYREFLEAKVMKARSQMKEGLGVPNAEVSAHFAKMREQLA